MSTSGRSLLVVVGLIWALAAACGGSAATPVFPSDAPSASVPAAGPLVIVETRGGECPEGACGSTTVVERDGRVHTTAPEVTDLGTAPPDALALLETEIDQADFVALASIPFTGECPTAFDGQETIFTFGTASGSVRLASCEVAIDLEAHLFVAAMNAISQAS